MSSTIPGSVQHLRSSTAGARPGSGGLRAQLTGELFVNLADHVLCFLGSNGQIFTIPDQVAIQAIAVAAARDPGYLATALAALAPTLPTTSGSSAGVAARVFMNDNMFCFG